MNWTKPQGKAENYYRSYIGCLFPPPLIRLKKRNLIKQCLATYTCEYEALAPELIAECSDMQDRWCKVCKCGQDSGLCSEYNVTNMGWTTRRENRT